MRIWVQAGGALAKLSFKQKGGSGLEWWGVETYFDGVKDTRVLAEVLDDPSQDAGRGVAGGEDHADDVVGYLLVGEAFFVTHKRSKKVAVLVLLVVVVQLPPGGEDFGQDLSQLLPGFHCLVKQCPWDVDGHRIVSLLQNVVTTLQILPVQYFVFPKYRKQRNIESELQQKNKIRPKKLQRETGDLKNCFSLLSLGFGD